MTIVAAIGFAGFVLLLLTREREFNKEREAWLDERQRLLDRIQFPEIRHVQPVVAQPADPPKDSAELAQVGLEVPEFVHVGGDE